MEVQNAGTDTGVTRAPVLPAWKRLEVARGYMKQRHEGTLNDNSLGQRFAYLIEAEKPLETNGAIEYTKAGFWRKEQMLAKLGTGRTLNNYVAKSPTDVLSSVVNTVSIGSQNVLARIDLEPIIYK
jgi:hypothetical protein